MRRRFARSIGRSLRRWEERPAPSIAINGAFRGQAVTGQQRFASEIARALVGEFPERVREIAPPETVASDRLWSWLWAQVLPFRLRRGEFLLTLTSRCPIWCPRQVSTVHDLFVVNHPEWYSCVYRLTHRVTLRAQMRGSRLLLAVSGPVGDDIRKLTRNDVAIVPNAPASAFSPRSRDQLEAPLAALGVEYRGYLLSVASADPRKNISSLVDAFSSLPEHLQARYPLVLVGGRNASFARADIPPSRWVRHLGYISDDTLAQLYAGARAVVLPSIDEGFGLPAVEALAAGTDVVAHDVPVLRWVCDKSAEYIEYGASPDDIARALTRLLSRDPTPESEAAARSASVSERFAWPTSARLIVTALDNLAADGRRG